MTDKERARDLFRQLDTGRGFHKYGCIRVHAESKKHFLAKCEKAWEIHEQGHQIGSELKLRTGGIIDLADMTTGEVFEFESLETVDKHRGNRIQLEENKNALAT